MIGLEMETLEGVGVAPIVEKIMETRLRWLRYVEREREQVDSVAWRVDQMKGGQITRGKGRLRKTITETIKKNLENNELDKDMIHDRTL
jgi:hypothetical protein